ncbi:MAG TPA: SDR family NAD(P)-dependent oxidoreductase [Pseudonocardia sp.]|nr:SDR family NAD(P)-dependent oxidoreductase [Pseudonocardia sp.]
MIDSTARVAVITGGGGRIGWATGRRLGADGWTVVLADIDPDAGRRAAADVGSRAESRFLDVADASSLRPFIDAVGTDHGRVDALICAAGIEPPLDLAGLDVIGWDRTLRCPDLGPQRRADRRALYLHAGLPLPAAPAPEMGRTSQQGSHRHRQPGQLTGPHSDEYDTGNSGQISNSSRPAWPLRGPRIAIAAATASQQAPM